MFSFPTELVSHKYYELLNIDSNSCVFEAFKRIRALYHEYHQTQFNIDILYKQILCLSIIYEILNDPKKRNLYNTYGDYLFDKLINTSHYNNNLLNYIFQSSEHNQEPLFIELPIDKMNSGTKLTVQYQEDNNNKKIVELEVVIPKRSKNNDLLVFNHGKKKISIFLKQKNTDNFFVFGNSLLYLDNVSFYDILLKKKYTLTNFYGNKLSIDLAGLQPWSILIYENQGLFSNSSKQREPMFVILNITQPTSFNYQTKLILETLHSQTFQPKETDIVCLVEYLFTNRNYEKLTPQLQTESTNLVNSFLNTINEEKRDNKYIIYKKLLFSILKENYLNK